MVAAKLSGAKEARVVFRHMMPTMYSHIIAAVTLAIPVMIISETFLSFLGLGLRPPAISWGVLLTRGTKLTVYCSGTLVAYTRFGRRHHRLDHEYYG